MTKFRKTKNNKRILIDLTSLSYHITGIERFALNIALNMIKEDTVNEYVLLFRNEIYKDFLPVVDQQRVRSKIIRGNQKLLFFQLIIPFYLYLTKADIYFFPAFPSPILFFNKNIYNTIHDMGRWDCPETGGLHLFYFKTTENIALKRAKKLFTVSEFSKDRIVDLIGRRPQDVFVVYNGVSLSVGVEKEFSQIKAKYGLSDKYIMFLSTLQPRKNLKLLLEAFDEVASKVDYDLILVGRKGWEIDELIEKYNSSERIIFTGFVEDEDLAVIYKNALCFVFPTLYEGFGIPPVEALYYGCPVLSSDSSCMKEVLRNQAAFFESDNKEGLIKELVNIEDTCRNLPRQLDDFQKENYDYRKSAIKIIDILNRE